MHEAFYLNHNFTNQNYPVNGPALMPYDFINCITHWEAYSRQSCYAAGQSSAERASDKDSLLHGHRFAETQSEIRFCMQISARLQNRLHGTFSDIRT